MWMGASLQHLNASLLNNPRSVSTCLIIYYKNLVKKKYLNTINYLCRNMHNLMVTDKPVDSEATIPELSNLPK